ncbi:SMP-30/gluconolactonase/LRE family protein [Bacteroides caecimuris]|uniref:SMP-30/gluconolactonase/LRE family protein n=1 Tax=Bacteroides caecimuris TaxID=1796613 RepID=UPI0026671319|nr:SMP-30/gluconolactonase/LRE family protein [Bacteroides caecimuris]
MKTLIHHLKRFSIYSLMFASICFVACEDENRQDMTPEIGEGEATPKITMYTPTAGGKSTSLTLYGTHFGTDLEHIRVTVNGVDAEVTGALGNIITANVQRGSGSGPVKVYLGQGETMQELTYKTEFEYSQSPIVSTYIGSYVPAAKTEKKEGTLMEAVLWKPGSIAFDKEGALYIVEDDDRDIRIAKNNQVATFLRGDGTGGTVFRMMNIAFSLDGNTLFLSNDANASGNAHIATMLWNKDTHQYDAANLSAIWSITPSLGNGVTNVGVHPVTGEVFSVAHGNAMIYKYDPEQNTMVATGMQLPDAAGKNASKVKIRCILFDKAGTTVYMSSQEKDVIYKGDYDMSTGEFSNLRVWVGQYEKAGFTEGQGNEAKLEEPCQMDLDEEGNIYVAVRKKHRIAKITPDGMLTNYTGTGTSGTTDGPLDKAQFNHPEGVQFGSDGALYVSDYWNHKIRKIEKD